MNDKPTLMDELRVLRQAVPGALVFVTVLLLLRGYDGTVSVLARQASMLAESFLGGPDVLLPLLLHTLPLALAAAIAAFAISAGWIRFESIWSVVFLSGIILAGTTIGGLLRTLVPKDQTHEPAIAQSAIAHPAIAHPVIETASQTNSIPGTNPAFQQQQMNSISGIGGISVVSTNPQLSPPLLKSPGPLQATVRPSAWQQLSRIDFLAPPNLTQPPPADIEPINAVPKISGILGVGGLAINQLLGFLVAYQPRLFIAAVLAGAWTGWRWQQRLQTLKRHVQQGIDDDIDSRPLRRAA